MKMGGLGLEGQVGVLMIRFLLGPFIGELAGYLAIIVVTRGALGRWDTDLWATPNGEVLR